MPSIIDVKKTPTWGGSRFPARLLGALYALLHQTAENYRQAAEAVLESHPEHAAILRRAIHPTLQPTHLKGCLDSSILAMGTADTPSMRDQEAQDPNHILPNHNARLELALITAQRTIINLRMTLERSLWNTTTAVGRAVTTMHLPHDTMYQLRQLVKLMIRSLNERADETIKPLILAWQHLQP